MHVADLLRQDDARAVVVAPRVAVFSQWAEDLLRRVWGYAGRARTRTVDSHASRLRNKLRAAGAELPHVINVWGRGYRLLE